MKRFRLFFVLGIALLVGGQSLYAQKQSKKEEKAQQIKEMIDSGRYTIEVNRALPMGGRSVNLTSLYSLEISGDSIISHLPYYGRAYSVPYGGGDGLRFEGIMTDHKLTYDKKGTAKISFKVRTDEDNFTFNIQAFKNASVVINVTPVNRQSISYHGDLVMKKEE